MRARNLWEEDKGYFERCLAIASLCKRSRSQTRKHPRHSYFDRCLATARSYKRSRSQRKTRSSYSKLYLPFKKYKAKVDLDVETDRVGKLLLDNDDSKVFGRLDKEKAKWWDKERSSLRRRAESFIEQMRVVQGTSHVPHNRGSSFTPWSGSVLDSIGVYLTPNVYDHQSSSAYLELCAKFRATKPATKPVT
ncbi:hypothetical protein Rs2_40970 [Raphanus sativus]|nr:hypothetical protein Rs2_40970 [Raphanus sativus]